jgi:hypothetical protein
MEPIGQDFQDKLAHQIPFRSDDTESSGDGQDHVHGCLSRSAGFALAVALVELNCLPVKT